MAAAAERRQGCTGTFLLPRRRTAAMLDRLSRAIGATQTLVASGRDLCTRSDAAMRRSRQAIQRTMALLDAARHHEGPITSRRRERHPRR